MAESSLFWDGSSTGDAGPYSGDAFSDFIRKVFIEDRTQQGVLEGYANELVVTGTTSPISVNTGAAMVDGKFYENTSSVGFVITTPASSTRIDRIVLRKNFSSQTVRLALVSGTQGAGSPPALTQTDGSIWEIPLYKVTISTSGIITLTDERYFLYTANSSVWRADNDGPDSGLNADLLDDAHKSLDDTFVGDSDYLIPSESAINGFIRQKYVNPSIYVYSTNINYPTQSPNLFGYNITLRNDGQGILQWNPATYSMSALVAGMFLVTGHAHAYADGTYNDDDQISIYIVKNGSVYVAGAGSRMIGVSGIGLTATAAIYLDAGEYVQIKGANNNIGHTPYGRVSAASATNPGYNGFSMTRL